MSRHADDPKHLDTVEQALRAWLNDGRAAAADVLANISPERLAPVGETFPARQVRTTTSTAFGVSADHGGDLTLSPDKDRAIAQLAHRHGYQCCYCERRLLSPATVAILGLGFGEDGLWPTHWNFTSCHPVILPNFPAREHIWPLAKGGHKTAIENLGVACWRCNATKGDRFPEELDWEPNRGAVEEADVLVGLSRDIWARGELESRDLGGPHRPWPTKTSIDKWLRVYL